MGRILIIANWKSHKTVEEAKTYLEVLGQGLSSLDLSNKEIIIAPPFTSLATLNYFIQKDNLPIKLASQNVSSFPEGAFTGEVCATQVKEVAEYVIIGHSERRKYLHESENDIHNKVEEAKKAGLSVVLCIQNEDSPVSPLADVIAYEPPSAISTFGIGKAENPDDVKKVIEKLEGRMPGKKFLYGGSVNVDDIAAYAAVSNCSGFLVGGASLDPQNFIKLLSQW